MMRLLLDTHILLIIAKEVSLKLDEQHERVVMSPETTSYASVASLWEIAIKARLGKLDLVRPVERFPSYFQSIGLKLLVIDQRHAVALVEPEPDTRDPFDRLLLAQCQVEGLRLVTLDRKLVSHPLVWRPQ